jgi:HAMP domain-containing protein
MELLRTLTLIYAAVLVLALAVSLVAIWVYLRRTAHRLAEARAALAAAQRETAPLEELLCPVRDLGEEASGELWAAKSSLEQADEHLSAVLERLGLAQPTA